MSKIISIVEDDENIREMVRMALVSFGYQVSAFENAEEALKGVFKKMPDLVVFDVMLPGMSGIEATRKIRANPKTKDLPIIMLTAKDSEMDRVTGLDVGADDYIAKPFSVMELGARIRAVLRRAESVQPPVETVAFADISVNRQTREVTRKNKVLDVTLKEYDLLCRLIEARDRVVPREELLNTVWGFDFVGETRTLDIHIRTLRQKLGDDADDPKYIKTLRGVGYRFIGRVVE